jgi:hypothetical protein
VSAPRFVAEFVAGLPDEDKERLLQVLGLEPDGDEAALANALVPFAKASLAEYVDQFTGRQLPTRMRDLSQLRLLYIARYAFAGRLPDPDKVADLFQQNSTEARTLVRNTATRYRYELSKDMNDAVWAVLISKAKPAGHDNWNVEVRDLALLEHMNEAVRRGPGNPIGIQRSKDEMHVYSFDKGTMKALLASVGKSYNEYTNTVK